MRTIRERLVVLTVMTMSLLSFVPVTLFSGAGAIAGSSPSFINYAGPSWAENSGEPTLGVNWVTGNVMMMTGGYPPLNVPPSQHVSRVTFDDTVSPATATWMDVTPGFMTGNVDPVLNVDPVTGRTFAGGDDGACTILARTDNDGATWFPAGNSCPGVVDHPTIAQGPAATTTLLSPDAVFVCQQTSVVSCVVSLDGGTTFIPSAPATCNAINPGVSGHLRIGPDGYAYLPFNNCGSPRQGVSFTANDGLTWGTGGTTFVAQQSANVNDPSVAIGRGDVIPGGRAYFAAKAANDHALVTTATGHTSTWTIPVDLTIASARSSGAAIGVQSIAFPTIIAGDDDRAAFAFLGTTTTGDAYADGFAGDWHLYVAITYDGGNTWTSYDATPSDPVQRGCIGLGGTQSGCAHSNLLDFMDITIDQTGRVLVGYADGCLAGCTLATSTSSLATIARQSCGPSLFASTGNVEGAGACPNPPGTSNTRPPSTFPRLPNIPQCTTDTTGLCGTIITQASATFSPPVGVAFSNPNATGDIAFPSFMLNFQGTWNGNPASGSYACSASGHYIGDAGSYGWNDTSACDITSGNGPTTLFADWSGSGAGTSFVVSGETGTTTNETPTQCEGTAAPTSGDGITTSVHGAGVGMLCLVYASVSSTFLTGNCKPGTWERITLRPGQTLMGSPTTDGTVVTKTRTGTDADGNQYVEFWCATKGDGTVTVSYTPPSGGTSDTYAIHVSPVPGLVLGLIAVASTAILLPRRRS